jgi:5-methyltetrahydrofolate--homocysteine methyltransferase
MQFAQFLARKPPILFDGAMGTQLAEHGLAMGGQVNLSHPEKVLAIHEAYAECGSQILITNTLTMNRTYIQTHNLGVDVREVNLEGARLAVAAARGGRYVLGDVSSTGKLLEPYGDLAESTAFAVFTEQAEALVEGGVDGFIIETMIDLREALCALRACLAVAPIPCLVTMAFASSRDGGRTIMGNKAEECAHALTEAGASAVGANCGDLDPTEMAEVLSAIRRCTALPLIAQPNAGRPKLVKGRTRFDMAPEDFVAGILACLGAGAAMVGGCCGTSPAHICAISHRLESLGAGQRAPPESQGDQSHTEENPLVPS